MRDIVPERRARETFYLRFFTKRKTFILGEHTFQRSTLKKYSTSFCESNTENVQRYLNNAFGYNCLVLQLRNLISLSYQQL